MTLPGFEDFNGLSARALEVKGVFLRRLKLRTPDNPVKSKLIEQALDLTGPEVRALVSLLRCNGEQIGSGKDGYYWCQTAAELQPTIDHIAGRISRLQIVWAGLMTARSMLNTGKQAGSQGSLL